jgi:hypothetical protein
MTISKLISELISDAKAHSEKVFKGHPNLSGLSWQFKVGSMELQNFAAEHKHKITYSEMFKEIRMTDIVRVSGKFVNIHIGAPVTEDELSKIEIG